MNTRSLLSSSTAAATACALLLSSTPAHAYFKWIDPNAGHDLMEELPEGSSTENATTATYGIKGSLSRADFVSYIVDELYANRIPGDCHAMLSSSRYWLYFSDVPIDAPYGMKLCTAMVYGYIDGYSDVTFRPNMPVNYAEASKVLTKIFGIATDPMDPKTVWYAPYVNAMRAKGVLGEAKLDAPVTAEALGEMISILQR